MRLKSLYGVILILYSLDIPGISGNLIVKINY